MAPMRSSFVALAFSAVVATAGSGSEFAAASHPCSQPRFAMTLEGVAVEGSPATFVYEGEAPQSVDWGDGSANGPRRIVRDRLRHRFHRSGRLTVTVIQAGLPCCDVNHVDCQKLADVQREVRIRIRRDKP